jgi:hypothetical protein
MPVQKPPVRPDAPARPKVAARLVTSAPEGLLRLDFSPPPTGTWTLVRAELARRLAELAVSRAATVGDADLAAFAVGRAIPAIDDREPAAAAPTQASGASGPERLATPTAHQQTAILLGPEMLTGEAFAARAGVSRATVALRRAAGRLLGLDSGTKRGFRYPAWQVELVTDPEQAAVFTAVLAVLRPHGPWCAYRFLTEPAPLLGGRAPLAAFAAGELESIRRAATGFAASRGRRPPDAT